MLPPEKRYPSSGTCRISLIKINKVAWTSIVDPFFVLIVVWFPPIRIGNDFLFPSKSESIGSITWSDPTDHAINVSEYILSIDNYSFFPGSYSAYIERLNSKGLKTNEMEIISVMIKGGYVFGFSLFLSIFFRLRYFAIFFTFTIFHYGYITSAPLILFVILFFEKEIRINQFIKTTL